MEARTSRLIKPGEVRVRIAPSPTGPFHIGTARTALFNWLFAKKYKGSFILRIEDTDLERSDIKYEKDIIGNLKWLGLDWDEGIDVGGDFAPYRQSERIHTYSKYLKILLDSGDAYYCYCTEEELEKMRQEQMSRGEPSRYTGRCRNLTEAQKRKFEKEGKTPIIRFKVPQKLLKFRDLIRGELEFDTSLLGDISIAKNLGLPLYNFAVVIDDHSMKISHVIRGEDHISNTPKQILIQEALGFPHPQYAHLPLILGPDKSKLSKRHGATAINWYKKEGFLPEAVINFMALLGWNPKTEKEIFTIQDLVKEFSLENVQKSGAVFNIEKLNWINGLYIRQMDPAELTKKCIPYLVESAKSFNLDWLKKIIALEQERIKKLSEIEERTEYFFKDKLDYKPELLIWKKMSPKEVATNLDKIEKVLSKIESEDFKTEKLKKALEDISPKDRGEVYWPLRVALTGRKASPGPLEIMEVLGKVKTLKRIKEAIVIITKSK